MEEAPPSISQAQQRRSGSRWADWYRTGIVIALVGYWVLLFVATHLPPRDIPEGFRDSIREHDKGIHFWAYGLLAGLGYMVIVSRVIDPLRRLRISGWLLGVIIPVYGLIDEITQELFLRVFGWEDWAYDTAGSWAVLAIAVG